MLISIAMWVITSQPVDEACDPLNPRKHVQRIPSCGNRITVCCVTQLKHWFVFLNYCTLPIIFHPIFNQWRFHLWVHLINPFQTPRKNIQVIPYILHVSFTCRFIPCSPYETPQLKNTRYMAPELFDCKTKITEKIDVGNSVGICRHGYRNLGHRRQGISNPHEIHDEIHDMSPDVTCVAGFSFK